MSLILSKDQPQGKYHQVKMLHRATYALGVIWEVEFHGAIHFFIRHEERSRSGQIRSNFTIHNFLTKTCLSCPVLSQYTNKCHLSSGTTNRMSEIADHKSDTIALPVFSTIVQPIKLHCFEILYACYLHVDFSCVFPFLG